ncbi:DUF1501 domain-containing protein [Algoriphagus machipongonensis]|uniref:Twin-arginine translocation pathway signal n=1 Tax=Algoriphagus machipongonensis TaxID=388413 RepID=A3I119_9BACT|nr:DUF1501 domain-containing protein [Algoriphagus machipongonensis]EAZ80165.1 twin-arginine translocation pathway signal [Algoriphagus machipongonensis]
MKQVEKLLKELNQQTLERQTRRHFLMDCVSKVGGLALAPLMFGCDTGSSNKAVKGLDLSERDLNPLAPLPPPYAGKAKSIIYLHMAGAPSQLELFDFKPELAKYHNKPCPESLLEGRTFAFIRGVPNLLGPQAEFKQHGESGAWVSDFLPHFSKVVDEVAFLKAVHTDQFNHGPAQLFMQTGSPRLGRPSLGSWVTYGLGTENQNLPGFVVLTSGGKTPDAGKSVWGSGFLPSVYQGVQCRSKGDPVLYLKDPDGMSRDMKKNLVTAINKVNKEEFDQYGDPEILARINQYEMAYRMQIEVPEVMDINDEPEYIHDLYGTQPGEESFANNCLLARKLVEKGVRFVQLYDWGWDSHGTDHDGSIDMGLRNKCREIDRPMSALLMDLKQRGLLEDTLVVWGGEFGRTPMQENREGKTQSFLGRDHHGDAFTMWMAGGGIKKGASYGLTDDFGFSGIGEQVSVHDVHATILHLMGFDHEQFTYDFQGRPFRLTDVEGELIRKILA